jgi:hypothetical protein
VLIGTEVEEEVDVDVVGEDVGVEIIWNTK